LRPHVLVECQIGDQPFQPRVFVLKLAAGGAAHSPPGGRTSFSRRRRSFRSRPTGGTHRRPGCRSPPGGGHPGKHSVEARRVLRCFESAVYLPQITPRACGSIDKWHVTEVRPSEVKHEAIQECSGRAEPLESLGGSTRDHIDRLAPHAVCPRWLPGLAVEEV